MTSPLNQFFDRVFCINLARRPERWAHMKPQFDRFGLEVHRFDAIDGLTIPEEFTPPCTLPNGFMRGAYGSLLSHLTIITLAKHMGLSSVFIFEDDAELLPNFNTGSGGFLSSVPDNWDMIYLGGRVLLDRHAIVPGVLRASYIYNNFAYGVRSTCYDLCISALLSKNHWADQLLSGLCPQLNTYIPSGHFIRQLRRFGSDNRRNT